MFFQWLNESYIRVQFYFVFVKSFYHHYFTNVSQIFVADTATGILVGEFFNFSTLKKFFSDIALTENIN
jgi:hypothetical protein